MTPATRTCASCKFWIVERLTGFSVGVCVGSDLVGRTRSGSSCGKWRARRARVATDPAKVWHPTPHKESFTLTPSAGSASFP